MATGGGALSAGDGGDSLHELAQKFGRVVGVYDVGRAAVEVKGVQKARYESRGLAVGKGEDNHSLSETVA